MKETVHETDSPEKTFETAFELARRHPAASFFYLHGELGAGKTLFTKGIASFHGIAPSEIASPTFALVARHSGGRRVLYHIDLYRLADPEELEFIGVRDLLEGETVCLVEWPERGKGILPPADIEVHITYKDQGRLIRIESGSSRGDAALARAGWR